jgi:hypothetical protein
MAPLTSALRVRLRFSKTCGVQRLPAMPHTTARGLKSEEQHDVNHMNNEIFERLQRYARVRGCH